MKHFWGKWRPISSWETKEFAEQDVQMLKDRGYDARLKSTKKPVKTRFGTTTGKRWFAEYYVPEGAEEFRNGKWMKRIDKNGDYNLKNLEELK